MVRNFFRKLIKPEEPRLGLALGGGAVLGAAHIGVLKAFEERKMKISAISGTSIGAFVAALFAFGKSPEEIEEIALHLKWHDITGFRLSKLGLLTLSRVQNFLEELLGYVEFEDSSIPLTVIATDIGTAEKVILKSGELAPAVIASMSLPGVFSPINYNGRMLVDGGLLEIVPVSPLASLGANRIIGVNLVAKRQYRNPGNILELLGNTFDITVNNITKVQTDHADLIIAPELSAYNPADTRKIPDLIREGYEEACRVLDRYLSTVQQGY